MTEREREPLAGAVDSTVDSGDVRSVIRQQRKSYLQACAASGSAAIPDPSLFLPEGAPTIRRAVLVELLKIALTQRFQRGEPARIEDLTQHCDGLLPPELVPAELVREEFQLRQAAGENVAAEEYEQRFPHLSDPLLTVPEPGTTVDRPVPEQLPEYSCGEVVDDFVILQPLGRGSFARVYLARQRSLRRLVALKVSCRGGGEPATLARLDHPHIVRVFDQRTLDNSRMRLLYLEYVPGGTLADVIAQMSTTPSPEWNGTLVLQSVDHQLLEAGQPAPEDSVNRRQLAGADWTSTVCRIGVQLATALDYAHRRGVLHRDIKPANILISAAGMPKLADFNISYNANERQSSAAAYFGGSLAYMSPEQLRAADPRDPTTPEMLDGRSDLYSLAVVLWELWQGYRPWGMEIPAANWSATIGEMLQRRTAPPEQPKLHRSDACAAVLRDVLHDTMHPDRQQRPATGAELAGRLRLAFHPEAARLFRPIPWSWPWLAGALWPTFVAAVCTLVPNAVAGRFNFLYNAREIIGRYPEVQQQFEQLAMVVNAIAFPLGVGLALWFGWKLQQRIREARRGAAATPAGLHLALNLGNLAALIGAGIWMLAALIYPAVLLRISPQFQLADAAHFFVSLMLCGLIAAAYPFLTLTWAGIAIYYPRLLRREIADPPAAERLRTVQTRAGRFLLVAAGVPLVAMGMLIARPEGPRDVLLLTVAAGGFGLVFAFFVFQRIVRIARVLENLLVERDDTDSFSPRATSPGQSNPSRIATADRS